MQERVRKVDVNKLGTEQADLLSQQIGEKVVQIQKDALEKMNRILSIYGMQAELSIKIGKIEEQE
jgi:hypothetical protein